MDDRLEIMNEILQESKKRTKEIDVEHRITPEFAELAKRKRPTFDAPYTEQDPLR